MAISGSEKSKLRAAGQTMPDDLRIGKGGLSEGFVASLRAMLARKELVKLRFTELEGAERKALAGEVAQAADAQLVAVTGRTALLYRANPELEASKRLLQ